jgi:hypothetical protein
MSRARKPAAPPDPLKPPPRAICVAIIERLLKEGQSIYWKRELPTFYRLWKQYPNVAFWQGYELPFGDGTHALNMMSWFEGDGATDLARAWLLFNWTPPEPDPLPPRDTNLPDPLDVPTSTQLHSPTTSRPRTIAEMLRCPPLLSPSPSSSTTTPKLGP